MMQLPDAPTLRQRAAIYMGMQSSDEYREAVIDKCRESTIFFINMFGWTYDPRPEMDGPHIPFMLYPFQVDTVLWIEKRLSSLEDGVIEKSRDMGLTWIVVAIAVKKWLFEDGFQALFGSRKEDFVDNGLMDSIFGKMEYFVERLPPDILPRGFNLEHHRMNLKLINPENGNAISGESANSNFSRAGRYTMVVFDEGAFWDNLESAWRAAAQTTRTRIIISTPDGINTFSRMRESGMYKVLRLHVDLHPLKDEAFKERERSRMSPEDYAQEIDISYQRSARGVVYPHFSKIPIGEFPFGKNMSLFTTWDFGIADDTAIVWIARNHRTGKLRFVDSYKNSGQPIEFYVPFLLGEIPDELAQVYDYNVEDLEVIQRHAQFPITINFGDPDVAKRSLVTGTSVLDVLRKWKIIITTNTKANNFRDRKAMTESGLREVEGINYPACAELVDSMLNARFEVKNPDSRSTVGVTKPIHDWTEAYRSSVEYFFVNVPAMQTINRPAPSRRKMAYENI
jgi:hypothetical protein